MFDDLNTVNKIEYLKGCLSLQQYEEVMEKRERENEEAVDELIKKGKDIIRVRMQEGRDHWEYLKENLPEMDSTEDLYELSYRKLVYYQVSMNNSGLETQTVPLFLDSEHETTEIIENDDLTIEELEQEFISNGPEGIEAAFSRVGRNIWHELDDEPQIRLAHMEDSHHLYLEFWLRAKDDKQFHERRGEYLEFPQLRKLECRVHLDEGFIELRGRNERKKDRKLVIEYVKRLLGGNSSVSTDPDEFEITDETINNFMNLPEFKSNPHSGKDGQAMSKWTADSDVREDPEYPDHRPHNFSNMVFNLDSVGRASFQLSAKDDSFRVFQHKITPAEHIQMVEYIWQNI